MNLYSYAKNSPTNHTDPKGLEVKDDCYSQFQTCIQACNALDGGCKTGPFEENECQQGCLDDYIKCSDTAPDFPPPDWDTEPPTTTPDTNPNLPSTMPPTINPPMSMPTLAPTSLPIMSPAKLQIALLQNVLPSKLLKEVFR